MVRRCSARCLYDETLLFRTIIELSIPAPLHEVWEAFTTEKGLSSWLAPNVSVGLKPGGDWLVKCAASTGGGTSQAVAIPRMGP
jgi:uncharacterized protein YndB with AHSA1/START domain